MTDSTGDPSADGDGPQDAFSLIGNETRATILQVLAAPEGEGPWKELSFSDLRERVDPEMDTSQFNYHLQKLVGQYVSSTESGYQINPSGVTLYRTIVAGTFTREASLDPIDADFECHFCGARVTGVYEDDQFRVRCPECTHTYARNILPPSVVDDGSDILHRVDQSTRHEMLTAAEKVCPTCLNRLDPTVIPAADAPFHQGDQVEVMARLRCSHCGATRYMTIGTMLLREASLVAFAYDHGIDVTETPVWEFAFAATDTALQVRSRDPWELEFSLTLDDETLELVVDADLEVIEERRV